MRVRQVIGDDFVEVEGSPEFCDWGLKAFLETRGRYISALLRGRREDARRQLLKEQDSLLREQADIKSRLAEMSVRLRYW